MSKVMIFTMHSTTDWWKYLGSRLDFASCVVISDLRGEGDISIVDDFYRHLRGTDSAETALENLGADACDEIILRCRTLRSLDKSLALRMIGAMWIALQDVFIREQPNVLLSFTIDRYVMDILERIARSYGVQFLEMTASILPNHIMFLQRGSLVPIREPSDDEITKALEVLAAPNFAPSYVKGAVRFSTSRYWRIFAYFELRGLAFGVIRWLQRDPLNLHYLDARKNLKHKVRFLDVRVLRQLRSDWEIRLQNVVHSRRVFLGLQLFPEASLDYWLRFKELLHHDDVILRLCSVLQGAGYHIFVKDHPLQFGFRQRDLIERLARLANVTLVPYDIAADVLLQRCAISVTLTGTIGFQAALAGRCSVVSDPYYSTEEHFVQFRNMADIDDLPLKIASFKPLGDQESIKRALVRRVLSCDAPGDYFSFRKFDATNKVHVARTESLITSLNSYLPRFLSIWKAEGGGL